MNISILFLIFNRPDTTAQVFEIIRKARPSRLYIAADGPRDDRLGEKEKVLEARKVALDIDWPCEVKTLFRDKNLGCKKAVSSAISWFFEKEEQGIILEDDCLVSQDFFRFSEELLFRYKENDKIVAISAMHAHGDKHKIRDSYFFSRYNHCWGWASWRRAWDKYDGDISAWSELKKTNWLKEIGFGSTLFENYWSKVFDRVQKKEIDSWAYPWTFSCWLHEGLTVLPSRNLVKNIGFGEGATHTSGSDPLLENLLIEPLEFPLKHPDEVQQDRRADRWSDRYVFRITFKNFLRQRGVDLFFGGYLHRVYRWLFR